jgi:hypothetical protein
VFALPVMRRAGVTSAAFRRAERYLDEQGWIAEGGEDYEMFVVTAEGVDRVSGGRDEVSPTQRNQIPAKGSVTRRPQASRGRGPSGFWRGFPRRISNHRGAARLVSIRPQRNRQRSEHKEGVASRAEFATMPVAGRWTGGGAAGFSVLLQGQRQPASKWPHIRKCGGHTKMLRIHDKDSIGFVCLSAGTNS